MTFRPLAGITFPTVLPGNQGLERRFDQRGPLFEVIDHEVGLVYFAPAHSQAADEAHSGASGYFKSSSSFSISWYTGSSGLSEKAFR